MVMQVSCRDRNRIAIQGDVLGASAMGVANILCLTGDGVQAGDHPEAKPVFDLDCMSSLNMIRRMRDQGQFLSGRKLSSPPPVFIGGAANPFAPPRDFRPLRLAKKAAAGAQFVQTQYCFDIPLFEEYMGRVRDLGLHEKVFILAGVGPLASAKVGGVDTHECAWYPYSRSDYQPPSWCRKTSIGRRECLCRNDTTPNGD